MGQSRLNPLVQNLFNLMRIIIVHRGRAHCISDQVNRFMVMLDFRILAENRRFMRMLDMLFQANRIGACKTNQLKQKAQQVTIIGRLPLWTCLLYTSRCV